MARFLLQFLVYNVILFSVLSCKTYELSGLNEAKDASESFENLYFSSSEDYVYKAQIDIYNKHLSGIIIIKKIAEDRHRIAFTTDFGNKLLDFEISENDFKFKYIIPDLDKKIVINFLKNDFKILLKKDFRIFKICESDSEKILISKNEKSKYFWFFDKDNPLPKKMDFVVNGKEKINFYYDSKTPIFANEIRIEHQDFKINFKLNKIEN